jgi:hypothetical protein
MPLDAITALHVHGAKETGEASWLWGEQEKCWPSVMQDDKMLPAVLEKTPACPQQPNVYLEPKWLR